MSNSTLIDAATKYSSLSVLPIGTDKKPVGYLLPLNEEGKHSWIPFQFQRADDATLRRWFADRATVGLAVVCGKISGGLLVLDFDEPRLYHAWCELVGDRINRLPVQRTGGGNFQVGLRCDDPGRNAKLAWVPDSKEKEGRRIGIETRGEGGYANLPPTSHPSGNRYEWITDITFNDAPHVAMEEVQFLLDAARSLCEAPFSKNELAKAKPKTRPTANGDDSVIAQFNRAVPIQDMLIKAGYTRCGERFTRPAGGNKTPTPGGVVILDGRSYHHSTNDGLSDGHAHDSFSVFCEVFHKGDCRQAVKAAAVELGIAHAAKDDRGEAEKPAGVASAPIFIRLSDVTREPLRWLWPGRIPLGKITLLAGDPGLGKSFLTLDMASRVSTGCGWPDAPGQRYEPGGVVLMSAEDDLSDTIAPRLDAAGADSTRIVALQAVKHIDTDTGAELERLITLANHEAIEATVAAVPDCRLVIVDPVSAYLGGKDSHVAAEVRDLLRPLSDMAQRRGVAVVCVTHLRKGDGAAMYRAMGSLAFVAAARAAFAVSKDAADPTGRRRLLLPIKNNLGPDETGLAYSLCDAGIGAWSIAWEAEAVRTTADEALSAPRERPGPEAEEQQSAAEWLRKYLADGPRPAADVCEAAREGEGIAKRTLDRAKKTIGAVAFRPANPGPWLWKLPDG